MTTIRIGLVLLFLFYGGATRNLIHAAQGGESVGSGLPPSPRLWRSADQPPPKATAVRQSNGKAEASREGGNRTPPAISPSQTPPSETPFQKGTVEVGVIGGAALPISLFRARTDRRLTMAAFQVGRVMTNQIGRGALAGHFELLLEITPLMVLRQPESVFGLAVSPVFLRWNFAPSVSHRLRLFGEASGGILYTSQAVPVRTTVFNFIDQAGFGLRFEQRPDRAWLMGYRFQHVSNGGRIRPNPGANFNLVYGGVTWLR